MIRAFRRFLRMRRAGHVALLGILGLAAAGIATSLLLGTRVTPAGADPSVDCSSVAGTSGSIAVNAFAQGATTLTLQGAATFPSAISAGTPLSGPGIANGTTIQADMGSNSATITPGTSLAEGNENVTVGGGELFITVSNQSTSSKPVQIASAAGDYVLTVPGGGSVNHGNCVVPTFPINQYTSVFVNQSGSQSQFIEIDNSNGQFASLAAGCEQSFTLSLNTTSGNDSVAVLNDNSGPATGDDFVGVSSNTNVSSVRASITAAEGAVGVPVCSSPDITASAPTGTSLGVDVVGQGGSADELDLSQITPGLTINAEQNTGSPVTTLNPLASAGNPGTVSGLTGGVGLQFSGQQSIIGPNASTSFNPGNTAGLSFTGGTGASVTNTIDLSTEQSNLFGSNPSFTVSMGNNGTCTGTFVGDIFGSGGASALQNDCFTNVSQVSGATAAVVGTGSTTVEPVSNCGSAYPAVFFQGNDATASNLAIIQGPASCPSPPTVTVAVNSNSGTSGPTVGTVTTAAVSTATFSGVSSITAPTYAPTDFQPGTVGGVNLVGDFTSPGSTVSAVYGPGVVQPDTLDLSAESSSLPFGVTMNGNAASPGSAQGVVTSKAGAAFSDTFSGIENVVGSPGGTTFTPGSAGNVTFTGEGSATANEVDLSGEQTANFQQIVAGANGSSGASTTIQTVQVTNSSSTVTTNAGGFPGVAVGMIVSDTAGRIPASDTVSSVSGNTLTLSSAANPNPVGTFSDTLTFTVPKPTAVISSFEGNNGGQGFLEDLSGYTGTGVAVGMSVTGPGIPSGTTVTQLNYLGSNFLVAISNVPTAVGTFKTLAYSTLSGGSTLVVPSGCSSGGILLAGGASGVGGDLVDCFSDVGTVNGAGGTNQTNVPTVFEPDPTLASNPANPIVFVGNNTGTDGSAVDLGAFAGSVNGLTTELNGDSSSANEGQVNGSVGGTPITFADFFGVNEVVGSTTLATTFRPDTAPRVDFVGQTSGGSGNDTLDLSNEKSASFGSNGAFTVNMLANAAPCSSAEGSLQSAGSVTLSDCFGNIKTVLGASALPTTFTPNPNQANTSVSPYPTPLFVGEDASAGGSVVDLTAISTVGLPTTSFASCSPQTFTGQSSLVADMGSDTSGIPASVYGSLDNGGPLACSLLATFYGVNQVKGSTSVATDFRPDSASSVTFVGGTPSLAFLDLSEPAAPSAVSANGNSTGSPGVVSGSSQSDSFANIGFVLGASGGSVFQPGSSTRPTFIGACGSSQTNIVDLSSDTSAPISVANMTTGTQSPPSLPANLATAAAALYGSCQSAQSDGQVTSGGVTTSFLAVTEVKGSTTIGTSFQPGASTGVIFVGQGNGITNTLDLSGASGSDDVTMNQDNASAPGAFFPCSPQPSCGPTISPPGTPVQGQGTFQQIEAVNGSTSGTGFILGANGGSGTASGGVAFTGQGSYASNTLYLPSSSSSLTVNVGQDNSSGPGDLTGLTSGFGNSTADSFSGIGVFDGREEGSQGATFNATDVPAATGGIVYNAGGTGTNTLSFASLQGQNGEQLDLNVPGQKAALCNTMSATCTNTSAGFTQIASFLNFSHFQGCASGSSACDTTIVEALNSTTAQYVGNGSDNILDFSKIPSTTSDPTNGSAVAINENAGTGTATTTKGSVTFSGVQFFLGTPNSDVFTVGSGTATFVGGGGPTTATFSNDAAGIQFGLAAGQTSWGNVSKTYSGTYGYGSAEVATVTTSNGTDTIVDVPTFVGSSSGGNTFLSDGFGGHQFQAQGPGNLLDLSKLTTSGLVVNATGSCSVLPDCVTGLTPSTVFSSSATDYFSGIQTFNGSKGGTTYESNGTGGLAFNGNSNNDVLDLSTAPSGVQVQDGTSLQGVTGACNGSVVSSSNSETFSDIAEVKGSANGNTTFVPTSGSTVFGGCAKPNASPPTTFLGQGTGNKIDISAVPTTSLANAYVVMPTGSAPGCVATTAIACSTSTTASELETFQNVQSFVGASSGNTSFVTGASGGFSFAGQNAGNTLSFANVSPSGGVQVFLNPNSQGQEVASPGSGTDTFTDLTTIDGSPGTDTFFGGPGNFTINGGGGAATMNDASAPNPVTVALSHGTGSVQGGFSGTTTTTKVTTFIGSSGGGNTFLPDAFGGYSFQVPGTTSGNLLSYANAENGISALGLAISNSTGSGTTSNLLTGSFCPATPPASGTTCSTDSFQGFQSFVGQPGVNNFSAGNGTYTLTAGSNDPANSLDLSSATAGVTFNLSGSTGTAISSQNKVDDTISGFTQITGSRLGGNTFDASPAGGFSLNGGGASATGNTLDLSGAPGPITVRANGAPNVGKVDGLNIGTGATPTEDQFQFIQTIDGSASSTNAQPTVFNVGCGGGQQLDGEGSGTQLAVLLNTCSPPPSSTPTPTINASVSPGSIAGLPGGPDTFSNVTTFIGPGSGLTTFIAPGSSFGLDFIANGNGNTFDASAFPSGATLNALTGDAQLGLSRDDSFSGVACFVGSTAGSTDFVAPSSALFSNQPGSQCVEHTNQPSFLGSGSGNILDLTAVSTSNSLPASVEPPTGIVSMSGSTMDTFAGVQSFIGAGSGFTNFVTGAAGGLAFTGQGDASSNSMSFADVPSTSGVIVTLNPNAQGQQTAQPGSGTDTFAGITAVTGSPGHDTFLGGPGDFTITGGGGPSTLSYSDANSPVSISLAAGTATATGAFSGTTKATGISTFIGSPGGGNSFVSDGHGGNTFQGPAGTANNSISFAGATSGVSTLTLSVTDSSGDGSATGLVGGNDTFQGFSTFTGSPANNTFKVGNGSYSLTAGSTGTNSVSFASASSGITANMSVSPATVAASGNVVNDTISGFQTITGASVGGNLFDAAPSGGLVFTGTTGGSSNTLNLSTAPGAAVQANGTSGTVTGLTAGFAGSHNDTYTGIQSVVGASGVLAGCTGGEQFSGSGTTTLTLALSACPGDKPTINAATSPGTITGLSGGNDTFTGITSFLGASFGNTTFVAPGGSASGYNFMGQGSGNTLDASAFPSGSILDATSGTAVLGLSASDSFSGMSCFVGSSQGSTDFIAPSGALAGATCVEHAAQPNFLGSGSSNIVDLSSVGATGTSPLTVTPPAGTVSHGGGPFDTFAGVQSFVGSINGFTNFVTGSTGGINFTGQASSNTLSFADVPAAGGVQISLNPNGQGQQSAQPGSGTDTFTGVTTVDGSPGNDTFAGGPGSWVIAGNGGVADTLTYASAPNPVTLTMAAGVATATGGFSGQTTTASGIENFVGSSTGGNAFLADALGGFSFQAPGGSAGNSLSFAHVSGVSGVNVSITSSAGNGTASGLNTANDSFQGIQTYIGSPLSDAFSVGAGAFTLQGGGSGTNSLSFASAPAGVSVNLANPTATATSSGGQVNDTISGFETFTGASVGNNGFVSPAGGGYSFNGRGNNNSLDLSSAVSPASGLVVAVNGNSLSTPGRVTGLQATPSLPTNTQDSFSGIQSFVGSSTATPTTPNTFLAGCTGGLTFTGAGRASVLQLALAGCSGPTPTPTISTLTSPGSVIGLPGGGGQDSFTGMTSLVGPVGGNTSFVASGNSANVNFVGQGPLNTLDASAFPSGSTLDAVGGVASLGPSQTDQFSGMSCFVGSTSGGTTFRAPAGQLPVAGCPEHPGSADFLATGTGNALDLTAVSTSSGAVATVSGGTVTLGTTPWDTYSSIQSYKGAANGFTTFVAAPGGGQVFTGQGTPLTNTLSFPAAARSSLVDTTTGTVTLGGGTGTLNFTGIASFVGSSVGLTTFKPDANNAYAFTGAPGSSGNTLDLSNAPSGISVNLVNDPASGSNTVTIPASPTPEVDTFTNIQNYVGAAAGGTSFTAPPTGLGGLSFTGQGGSGNQLFFTALPAGPPLTIDLQHGTVAYSAWAANDTFAGIQSLQGSRNSDTFLAAPVTMTISGDGGSDTISFANANAAANVTLGAGTTGRGVATGGFVGTPAQLTLFDIQNVVSSPFGGTITGNALPSVFTGSPGPGGNDFVVTGGTDVIDGGGNGANTLDLSHATKFVTLNLGVSGPQVTGGAGILTVVPGTITNVIGGGFGNRLIAGPGNVTLNGGVGTDWLQAGSGTDFLNAGSGPSTLVGGTGFDTMTGGAANDTFIPGTGGGKITDTAGVGTLDYALATAGVPPGGCWGGVSGQCGVLVNLSGSAYTTPNGKTTLQPDQATGGGGAPEQLVGLQNIVGTNFGDILVGNSSSNSIQDGNGTNLIVGNGGGDVLSSGSGVNLFITGSGNNTVHGGSGTNTISYANSPGAVNVNLAKGTAKNGWGGTDTLSGITNIIGSPNNGDVLALGPHGGEIIAGKGSTTLIGSSGGNSTMLGGAGSDTFTSSAANDHMIGGSGDDDFLANNGFIDYMTGGSSFNIAFVDCLDVKNKTYTNIQELHQPQGGCGSTATATSTASTPLAPVYGMAPLTRFVKLPAVATTGVVPSTTTVTPSTSTVSPTTTTVTPTTTTTVTPTTTTVPSTTTTTAVKPTTTTTVAPTTTTAAPTTTVGPIQPAVSAP